MSIPLRRTALLVLSALAALAAPAALAGKCELALLNVTNVVDIGRRAAVSNDGVDASNLVASARIPSIDAAQQAKACGCPDAVPPLAETTLSAARANVTYSLTTLQQYGATIRKNGDAALAILRQCDAR